MRIAVFCGSGFGNSPAYRKAAEELGQWISDHGYGLVYGGGDAGLMGIVGKTVHDAGNEVIGVLPGNIRFITERPQQYVTECILAKDLADRKRIMIEKADVFIALPGGTGTLDEIAEAITLSKITPMKKPCILFNRNHYYDPLKSFFEGMIKEGFAAAPSIAHLLVSDDLNEIETFING